MLTKIILCAQPADKKIWRQLPVLLQGLVSSPDVQLCSLHELPSSLDRAMIIVKGVQEFIPTTKDGKEMVAVVDDSDDAKVLHMVKETGLPTITCGLSSCNTITLSSRCADSAVVTLQRTIRRFDGILVEPQELPIRMSQPLDGFLLMALAAICLFVGTERLLCRTVLTLKK